MIIAKDRIWAPYQEEPLFLEVLEGTARAWVSLLAMYASAPAHRGTRLAYDRAVLALAQLPIEYEGPATRFERSRWRASTVQPGVETEAYCEHPWTKKRTKDLVWAAGMAALQKGVAHEELVSAVGAILGARQDTVLLPHGRLTELGVYSERHHEGLAARYTSAIESGRIVLIDRLDGSQVGAGALRGTEAESARRVRDAVERLAGPVVEWSAELGEATDRACGASFPVSAASVPDPNWVGTIRTWLVRNLGADTKFTPKGYLAITPADPRKRKGALHRYDGVGTPLLVFRSAHRDHWVARLKGWGARPGDEDRIQIPLPHAAPLDELTGAVADWS